MIRVTAAFAAVSRILATYPAISTALVSFGVVVAAFFGLSITGDQLIYMVGVVSALGGMLVHSNVIPMARSRAGLTEPAAGAAAVTRTDTAIPNG